MARITVEDCLKRVPNRFAVAVLAFKRARQLLAGAPSMLDTPSNNKVVVTALREIGEDKVELVDKIVEEHMEEAATEEAGSLNGDSVLMSAEDSDEDVEGVSELSPEDGLDENSQN